jgi:hypothetical protein
MSVCKARTEKAELLMIQGLGSFLYTSCSSGLLASVRRSFLYHKPGFLDKVLERMGIFGQARLSVFSQHRPGPG